MKYGEYLEHFKYNYYFTEGARKCQDKSVLCVSFSKEIDCTKKDVKTECPKLCGTCLSK